MHQLQGAAGRLHLVPDPVPVADGFHRYGGAWLTAGQELPECSRLVGDPFLSHHRPVWPFYPRPGVALMHIEGCVQHHAAPPPEDHAGQQDLRGWEARRFHNIRASWISPLGSWTD